MSDLNVKKLRQIVHLYLSAEVASCAEMSIFELQQFVAGTFRPSEQQLKQLAKRVGMTQ